MTDEEIGELSDDAIAGAWRLWQRVRGHRYSLDDVATAREAVEARPDAQRVIDLGCGIGSVTLMVAYKLRDARVIAIEAQAISHELARRNLARNALTERVRLIHGDLRTVALEERADLITGTPPYFDPKKSSPSTDSQRTYARIEMRGGIEDYVAAGARLLAPGGRLVVCGDARRPDRAMAGAAAAGLDVIAKRDVVPRADKDALFTIWTFALRSDGEPRGEGTGTIAEHPPIVARTADGARTEDAHALRRFFDQPVNEDEAPSPRARARRAR
ncbi:tRNA (adenine37-N(6))-methyltransferase TrmN6 [Sandaracinus amylolyticus]|uniref:tRNA (Adenine37-N(6))-methyltransferase TrmN6 n=1 Tax=Sandaracinus amylolyticus TaxID=927083 RepID=A0A0F6WAP5_9BACT|nr:tRNA (adenine37-N(6))-methyltransferase TrmN6 [Sandaracinus amylolyticus]